MLSGFIFYRTLANYLLWKVVESLNFVGGKQFAEESYQFAKVYSGKKARSPLWDACTSAAMRAMPFAYGRMYVDLRFKSKFAKKDVSKTIS